MRNIYRGLMTDLKSLKKDKYFLKSLSSGIRALEVIAESDRPISLSEIANHLKTNKTTATRICYTLSELQLLQRDEHNKYSLTPKILKFGYASLSALGWRGVARFYLENLSKETQETVSLSVLDGTDVMFILRIRRGDFFPFETGVGTRLPAHCAAMGKALVAFQSPEKRKAILDKMTFRSLTVHSIKSSEAFNQELNEIRRKGYAVNYEEVSIGVCGVSAPVTDIKGEAISAVSISSSIGKYNKNDLESKLAPAIVRNAREISDALAQMELPELH